MTVTILSIALLALAPSVNFTTDSAYKNSRIVETSIVERVDDEDNVSYDLALKEAPVLGYCIYDNPDTDYIDGIKVNNAFLASDWCVKDIDLNAQYTITVKTAYTDDIAGWLAMAKNGDFSALLSHPAVVMQLVYYALAAISIVLGGFGLLKAKKTKIKSANEIAEKVGAATADLQKKFDDKVNEMENASIDLISAIMEGTLGVIQRQNDTLIQATVLARSGDESSTLALLDLLKNAGSETVEQVTADVKKRILEARERAEATRVEAIKSMKEAVAEISAPAEPKGGYDGTSI